MVCECSGELVEADEPDYLLCLTACCLFSRWDFSIISLDRSLTFNCSHDDDMSVESPDPGLKQAIFSELRVFGLKEYEC